jgi:peptidoglycan hydrolase CwlO-like protein
MKTELDLLAEALRRLDVNYQQRDRQLDQQLSALAAQVESLTKHVNASNAYVSSVAAQVTRSQEQHLSTFAAQVEDLTKRINGLTTQVVSLIAQLARLQGH